MTNTKTIEDLREEFYDIKERLSDDMPSEEETQEFLNWLVDLKQHIKKEITEGNPIAKDSLSNANDIEKGWRELFGRTLQ